MKKLAAAQGSKWMCISCHLVIWNIWDSSKIIQNHPRTMHVGCILQVHPSKMKVLRSIEVVFCECVLLVVWSNGFIALPAQKQLCTLKSEVRFPCMGWLCEDGLIKMSRWVETSFRSLLLHELNDYGNLLKLVEHQRSPNPQNQNRSPFIQAQFSWWIESFWNWCSCFRSTDMLMLLTGSWIETKTSCKQFLSDRKQLRTKTIRHWEFALEHPLQRFFSEE